MLSNVAVNSLGEMVSPCLTPLLILIFSLSLCRCSVTELSVYVFQDFYKLDFYKLDFYKLFTKIITTRLEKKLDENQPREQAGFRSKYSTTDHIHAINQLKEKCREYNIPLCVAFVDYEKAFDSVQTQAILTSLQEQGIEDVYIEILKDIETVTVSIKRRLKQK